jgi:hypothetical protein
VLAERAAHPGDPGAVLRWYAGVVGDLACGPGFRGCPFINAAAELPDGAHPGRRVIDEHRRWLTGQIAELVTELTGQTEQTELTDLTEQGSPDAASRARQLMMLRDGAMVAGYTGRHPESVAADLLAAGTAILTRH